MNIFNLITINKAFGYALKLLYVFLICALFGSEAFAVVTITRATGGTNISADNSANAISPAYTLLGNVVITEGAVNDFSTGTNVTFTLAAPSGWTFNPFSSVNASANLGGDIASVTVLSVSATTITVRFNVNSVINSDILTVSGIEVRANEGGNIPTSANITRGGTAVISGCVSGANLGSLSQIAGAVSKLVITLPGQAFSDASMASTSGNTGTPANQTAGTAFTISKIRACDQFFNVVTNFSGVKTLNYSGPSNGLTSPSYTISVSFASGVSSTALTTTLKKAETTAITVNNGSVTGPASSSLTVNAGSVSNFLVQSSGGGNISSQITGIPFSISVTARDANNNICSSGPNTYSGTVDLSSSGTLTSGGGTTGAFSSGVLSSQSVTISNGGNFTITATRTSGSETGISNSFAVNYPPSSLSSVSPVCVDPGGSGFVLTANGTNFTGTSVVQINGSNRSTTFINPTLLHANILASDIASPGSFQITVFDPSSGTTAPQTLNTSSSSVANISTCQGTSYTLPDGLIQNTSGTYVSTITNAAGCDSVITTYLTVDPSPTRTENISICQGTSYVLPDGSTQSTPGTYVSFVTSISGCDSVITTNLSLNPQPSLAAVATQIDCFGGTGSVQLFTSNGQAPFTYGPEATTNLTAGTYNYSVTDANGCSDNTSATINAAPSQLTLSATATQIACFGNTGSVTLNAAGGTTPYTYGGSAVSGLTPGSYSYSVTDNNGCAANDNATINAEPAAISATMAITKTPCGSSLGALTVTATGGTSPYTYSWNTTPVRTTRTITGLPVGTYTVIITDNNGCTSSKTATVTNLNAASFNITGTTGICPGGNITLCAKPGFTSYAWSTGQTTQCISTNVADTIDVIATDSIGCQSMATVVTRNSTFPNCTITGGTLCANNSLTLRAPTGFPYYHWNNNATTSTLLVRNAGTYTVTVRNSDGCSSTCSYTVNTPMRIAVTKVDGKCTNGFLGSASVTAYDGVPPYSYLWSNGATTSSITGLNAGVYTIRVTDAGNCLSMFTVTINANKSTYDYSTIGTNFNATPISPGSYLWFSAVANVTYTGNYPVTIKFTNQNITSTKFNLVPPNSKLIITNAVSQASTVFTGGEWVTTAPPNVTGNYFISGYSYPINLPIAGSLPTVKWKGVWSTTSSCVTNINWKWTAATYSSLTVVNSQINVNPVDDISYSPYGNGNPAGTPENYTGYCIAGGLSTGGSDFVGTYTTSLNRLPCSVPDQCNSSSARIADYNSIYESKNFILNAYPNPFSSKTNIEFEVLEKACHLSIDIYTLFGEKITTVFNEDIEAGGKYRTEFDAGNLPSGIYVYRLISDDEVVSGRILLQR